MSHTSETICALATPRGQGAVGMVRLSGPEAHSILKTACGVEGLEPRRMIRAWLRDPRSKEPVDQVMVCAMEAPRSYTGEDVVEVYGHGGELNMDRVLALLLGLGARLAEPGEFTRRAFLNGRLDLTQAEAVAQLIAARSDRAARNAVATLAGGLGERIRQLRHQLLQIAASLEARIDFADDVDAPDETGVLLRDHREAAKQVTALARSYVAGRRLDGATVALVGPVNAGKSSLFNCLLQTGRALVSEEPGTTRDYLEAEVSWQGRRVTLVDTAGSRQDAAATPLERAGRRLARGVVKGCDLVVIVVDLSDPEQAAAGPNAQGGRQPVVVAANKLDLCAPAALEAFEAAAGAGSRSQTAVVGTSALRGSGIDRLRESILEALGVDDALDAGQEGEQVLVTRRRQHEALLGAEEALAQGARALDDGLAPELTVEHYRQALDALGQITGETYTEHVLDTVFERFCVGK